MYMPRLQLSLIILAGCTCPLVAQDAAPAQEDSQTTTLIKDGSDIQFNFHASSTYYADSDFDDASGSLKAWRNALGVSAQGDLGEGRWSVGFNAEITDYDFTPPPSGGGGGGGGARGTIGALVFDDVTILGLTTRYTGRIDDENSWFIGGGISAAFENGADLDDSFTGAIFGGASHKYSDKLTLGLGVLVRTRLEDSVLVIPMPIFRYDMGNGWTLENQRAGAKIMYAANDKLSFGVAGEFESRSFRLDDANALPGGAANETRIPVAFVTEYKAAKKVTLSARVGAAIGSDIEFFDATGATISERDLDTSIFFGFSGTIHF